MDSYNVIANQPVVIDNVSFGLRCMNILAVYKTVTGKMQMCGC